MDVLQKGSQPHYYQNDLVHVHKPESAAKDEWYPQREALLYRDRKFLRMLSETLSGKWQGFFLLDAKRYDFTLELLFKEAIVTGEGQDHSGPFTLEGVYSDEDLSLVLVKKYTTHTVEFRGHYKGDRAFSGEWSQPGASQGFFELRKVMERGKGLLPSPQDLGLHDHSFLRSLEKEDNLSGDWVGHCTQDGNIYDLKLSLVFQKAVVSGCDSDVAGKFKWSGLYDSREMHLSLIKNYPTHRVYFNGFYKSNKSFEGDWVLDDFAQGAFRVTKQ